MMAVEMKYYTHPQVRSAYHPPLHSCIHTLIPTPIHPYTYTPIPPPQRQGFYVTSREWNGVESVNANGRYDIDYDINERTRTARHALHVIDCASCTLYSYTHTRCRERERERAVSIVLY
jgi:hypothetical protein